MPDGEWFAVLADGDAATAAARLLRPLASQVIAHASGRPWLLGRWPDGAMTPVEAGRARVVVAGESPATTTGLRARLAGLRSVGEADAVVAGLPGSYHLVASVGGQVRVQGTLTAVRRVFHARVGDAVVACDRARVLARLTGADWDPRWLAVRLTGMAMPFPWHDTSPWPAVRALPCDHWLRLDGDGRAVERRWWRAPDPVASRAEGAPQVRAALAAAVSVRTADGGTVSTDMSGGMDSSSLAFLAARGPAQLVTYRWAESDAANDDVRFARLAISRLRQARHLVEEVGKGPATFAGLDARTAACRADREEPFGWVLNQARIHHDARVLAAAESRVHLSGYGGDELFHPGGTAHVHDLMRRHPLSGLRQARDYRLMARASWPTLCRALADRRTPAEELAARARELTAGTPHEGLEVTWTWPLRMPHWASGQAVAAARELMESSALERPEPLARWRAQHEMLLLARCTGVSFGQSQRMSRRAGLPLAAPFLDDQVVEAALAVAPEERVGPRGYKPLLAAAMHGIVPDQITSRTTKGEFSVDLLQGFARHRGDLLDLIADSRLARQGLIDAEELRKVLARPDADAALSQPLDATLACEMWLRALEADAPAGETARSPRGTGPSQEPHP